MKPGKPFGPWISIGVFLIFFGTVAFVVTQEDNWPTENRQPMPLRRALDWVSVANKAIFSHRNLAPTYRKDQVTKKPKSNGVAGMGGSPSPIGYVFRISDPGGDTTKDLKLTLDDLKALPHQEIVYNFKCIEGWSQITWWGGVCFADVVKKYGLGSKGGQRIETGDEAGCYRYCGLESMDRGYYVGIDMPSMMHPQTLLAWEMNGEPLPPKQGAPLRLIIPVKYGVKNLMKIGRIYFQDAPPRDYWYERGYAYDLTL